jgi:hypothetical protein
MGVLDVAWQEWYPPLQVLGTMLAVFSAFFAIYKFWVQQRLRRQYASKLEEFLKQESTLEERVPAARPPEKVRPRRRMPGNDLAELVDDRMNDHFARLIALINTNDRRNGRVNFALSLVFYVLGVATPLGLKHFFGIG